MRDELFNLLQAGNLEATKTLLSQSTPEDIAHALRDLPSDDRVRMLQLLDQETAVTVFELLGPDVRNGDPAMAEQAATLIQSTLKLLLSERQFDTVRRILTDMNPVDVARVLEAMPPEEEVVAFRLLPKDAAIQVFEQMDSDEQQQLLSGFTDERARDLIAGMSPDDRARLLDELPAGVARRLVQLLPPRQREATLALLGYSESSAGRVMTPDFVDLRASMTVARALERIRRQALRKETIYYAYVMDTERRLQGTVSLRELVIADPETLVGDMMTPEPKAVTTDTDQEAVAKLLHDYDLLAVPVVDHEQRLVGIITWDDVADIMEEEATEDIYRYGAVPMTERSYFAASTFTRSRRRVVWLFFLVLVNTITGTVIAAQEELLAQVHLLAAFIPLLIDTGGNIGSQSSTIVVRGLATGEVAPGRAMITVARESWVGTALGVTLGIVAFAWAMMLGVIATGEANVQMAAVVGTTLAGIALLATVVGAGLPFLFRLVKVDPAVASAPLVTTVMDISGVVLYFLVANALLRL